MVELYGAAIAEIVRSKKTTLSF